MKALLEVFTRPGELFASLPERDWTWVAPIILNGILVLLINLATMHFMGVETVVRQQVSGFAPPEQVEQLVAQRSTPAAINTGYVISLIVPAIFTLVVAGCLLIFSMMTSKQPKFGKMYAMVALAFFPLFLISSVMTWGALALSPDPSSMDIRNLLATNVGAFMDRNSTGKVMYSLMSSIDVLSFAQILFLGYGFSKLTRSSMALGVGAVVALWAMYVAAKAAVSTIF